MISSFVGGRYRLKAVVEHLQKPGQFCINLDGVRTRYQEVYDPIVASVVVVGGMFCRPFYVSGASSVNELPLAVFFYRQPPLLKTF